jgi:hypothetical protein
MRIGTTPTKGNEENMNTDQHEDDAPFNGSSAPRAKAIEAVYDAIVNVIPTNATGLRHAALAYAISMEADEETIAAICELDLERPAQNVAGLAWAWLAMNLHDSGQGDVGALLPTFVDLVNDPATVKYAPKRNVAVILKAIDKVKALLLADVLGGAHDTEGSQ